MRNALSIANNAVQKINGDDMSSRANWKKTQSTVDTEGGGPSVSEASQHSCTENKEVISCSGQTQYPEPEKKYKGQQGYEPSETSAKASRLVVWHSRT